MLGVFVVRVRALMSDIELAVSRGEEQCRTTLSSDRLHRSFDGPSIVMLAEQFGSRYSHECRPTCAPQVRPHFLWGKTFLNVPSFVCVRVCVCQIIVDTRLKISYSV